MAEFEDPSRRISSSARSLARRRALLDAAEAVLVEVGIEGFVAPRVAERAGVAKASVYQHFPARTDLLYALAERHLRRIGSVLLRVYACEEVVAGSLAWRTLIERVTRSTADYYAQTPVAAMLLLGGNPCRAVWQLEADNRRYLAGALAGALAVLRHGLRLSGREPDPILVYQGIFNGMCRNAFHLQGSLTPACVDQILAAVLAYLSQFEEGPR